jgi:thiamine transporter
MNTSLGGKRRTRIYVLSECAIMIALATVLSIFKLADLPYGGSITLASMLPLVILSYRNGIGWGLGSAAVYGVLQQLIGLKTLSYFTTWQSIVAIIVLDYVLAFAVLGLAGLFRRRIARQNLALTLGAGLGCLLRYLCHVISGATVWAGLSIPDSAAIGYSFIYNATYMIPETIILCLTVAYLGSILDFGREVPVRMKAEKLLGVAWKYYLGAGFALLLLLIVDTTMIFSVLQNAEDGTFTVSALSSLNWVQFGIVTAICLASAALLFALGRRKSRLDKA